MEIIWDFPSPPTSLYDGPVLKSQGGRQFSLEFSFENERGDIENKCFTFKNVWAYRCDFLYAIRRDLMEKSYGKLVELPSHAWLEEIRYKEGQYGSSAVFTKVFVITFDDGPCYQFLCEQVSVT
ncbi:hypothetical protein RMR21_023940 (plasmid) [Agrobacterium sp. rho-8.1]|nr:hypothetical protein [Agrobacterium sp. rho-8.1]